MAQILFPVFDRVILVPLLAARAAALDDLTAAAKATGTSFVTAESVSESIASRPRQARPGQRNSELIVVSGSVYASSVRRGPCCSRTQRPKNTNPTKKDLPGGSSHEPSPRPLPRYPVGAQMCSTSPS